jgi:hypothetical protein
MQVVDIAFLADPGRPRDEHLDIDRGDTIERLEHLVMRRAPADQSTLLGRSPSGCWCHPCFCETR